MSGRGLSSKTASWCRLPLTAEDAAIAALVEQSLLREAQRLDEFLGGMHVVDGPARTDGRARASKPPFLSFPPFCV